VYNVAVGQDKPIGSEHKSLSATIALARLSIALPACSLRDLDLRNRRADLFRS